MESRGPEKFSLDTDYQRMRASLDRLLDLVKVRGTTDKRVHRGGVECVFDKQPNTRDIEGLTRVVNSSNLVEATYKRVHGLDVGLDDIKTLRFNALYPIGQYRTAYRVSPETRDGRGLPDFVAKMTNTVQPISGNIHQYTGRKVSATELLGSKIGGVWAMDDGRIVLTQEYVGGENLGDFIREMHGDKVEGVETEVVRKMVDFWSKTGGYFISDPHEDNFRVFEEGDKVNVKLIDTGSIRKYTPRKLLEEFLFYMEVAPYDEGIDGSSEGWLEPDEIYSRKAIVEGVINALGEGEGRRFLKNALESGDNAGTRLQNLEREFRKRG